jgi:hypothetical protein
MQYFSPKPPVKPSGGPDLKGSQYPTAESRWMADVGGQLGTNGTIDDMFFPVPIVPYTIYHFYISLL